MEGHRRVQNGKRSGGGTCDGTEHAWMGKDNEVTEMVPMIVHVERYAISKGWRKKWACNQHACNVQDSSSMTPQKTVKSQNVRNVHQHPKHTHLPIP